MGIHPAASRGQNLAKENPAMLILFVVRAYERGKSIAGSPLSERRPKLDAFAKKYFAKNKSIELSPATKDLKIAKDWLAGAGGDVDGVIAKRTDLPYQTGNRDGMVRVKLLRTVHC